MFSMIYRSKIVQSTCSVHLFWSEMSLHSMQLACYSNFPDPTEKSCINFETPAYCRFAAWPELQVEAEAEEEEEEEEAAPARKPAGKKRKDKSKSKPDISFADLPDEEEAEEEAAAAPAGVRAALHLMPLSSQMPGSFTQSACRCTSCTSGDLWSLMWPISAGKCTSVCCAMANRGGAGGQRRSGVGPRRQRR